MSLLLQTMWTLFMRIYVWLFKTRWQASPSLHKTRTSKFTITYFLFNANSSILDLTQVINLIFLLFFFLSLSLFPPPPPPYISFLLFLFSLFFSPPPLLFFPPPFLFHSSSFSLSFLLLFSFFLLLFPFPISLCFFLFFLQTNNRVIIGDVQFPSYKSVFLRHTPGMMNILHLLSCTWWLHV